MIIAAAVEPDGTIGHSWGKAATVAVARIAHGEIVGWREHEVDWAGSHDRGSHGSHHATVVSFLRAQGVQMVLARQVGEGMRRMLGSMGVELVEGVDGDAKSAMVAATQA